VVESPDVCVFIQDTVKLARDRCQCADIVQLVSQVRQLFNTLNIVLKAQFNSSSARPWRNQSRKHHQR